MFSAAKLAHDALTFSFVCAAVKLALGVVKITMRTRSNIEPIFQPTVQSFKIENV